MFSTTYSSLINHATFCAPYHGGSLSRFIDDGIEYGIYLNGRQPMFKSPRNRLSLERHNDEHGNTARDYTLCVLDADGFVVDVATGDLDFLEEWAYETYNDLPFPKV